VHGSSFEVIGQSSVVVIDPRGARVDSTPAGQPVAGVGLKLSVLHAGMKYELD
jgi:cyanophycinase-like exopeptidase